MNRRLLCLAAASLAVVSPSAWSSDAFFSVFFDANPMQSIEIHIDDELIGITDGRGFVSAPIDAGEHSVDLYRDNVRIASTKFQTLEGQDAELSIIGGLVTDLDGVAIADALVKVSGFDAEVSTDSNGTYELTVPRGFYEITIEHPDFKSASIYDVRVLGNTGSAASVKLRENAPQQDSGMSISIAAPVLEFPVEELVVLGSYKPATSGISLERFSTSVIDALDIEQMTRFGDGNIAAALTRLAGVAVTGDQYANVRGLDGRYLSVSLNGFLMPSTDPLTRDIQLDLFPSGILDGVAVQKSYSPYLLGSTTGGALGISTKGLPDGKVFSASVKLGGNTDITGDEIVTFKGSNGDWIGRDLGLRSLSNDVLAATENGLSDPRIDNNDPASVFGAAAYAVAFEDDYNVRSKTANPNFGLSVSFGNITDSGSFGYYGALSYDYETSVNLDARLDDALKIEGEYERAVESYSIDGYFVFGSQFRADDEVLSKTILLRDSTSVTERRTAFDNQEDNTIGRTYLEWTERQLLSQQFEGSHSFDVGANLHELDWGIAYSNTVLYQPDRRQYDYLANVLILNALERRWLELDEDSVDVTLDYKLPFEIGSSVFATLRGGLLISDKERVFEQYRFGLDLTLEIGDSWTAAFGARQEDYQQKTIYPNQPSAGNSLNSDELLPAVSLTWAPNDEWQFRAAASQTISYPGIIERSEARIFRQDGRLLVGNPDLDTSSIENLDFRIEYYFSDEESISLAFFSKIISDPIEIAVLDGSGSATGGFTFRQNEEATLNGVEIDGRINMFDNGTWLGFVSGNLTFIESEVDLNDSSLRLEGEQARGRELQSQSPFLANLQLGFDHFPTEQKFTILFNYFDDRIFIVERAPRNSIYETGRGELNVNYEKTFNMDHPLTFKAQVKNLLNPETEYVIDDQVLESFKRGIEYSFELGWEF